MRVVFERLAGVKSIVPGSYPLNVGRPAVTKITRDLHEHYGDGICHFILWSGMRYKRTSKPKCEEKFKVKLVNGHLRFLRPDHPRPCTEFLN